MSLRQTGFSLIELMVAITIGFIVVAGVGYLYLGSRQAFNAQDSLSAIQENGRFALDTMSRDIRMAGYMGCGNLAVYAASPGTLGNITKAPAIAPVTPASALQVFPGGTGWTAPAGVSWAAGDVLRVSGVDPSGVSLAGPALPGSAAAIHVSGNPGNFQANDVLLISDCTNAVIFVTSSVSNAPGMVTFAHASNVNTVPYLSATHTFSPSAPGSPGAQVYAFRQADYFVGCPTASFSGGQCSVPLALYQVINNGVPQALVDNVENMAFMLGVDTSAPPPNVPPAQVVGAYQTPAAVANAGNWAKVLTVQVHLLMVGGPANDARSNVAVASQPYSFIVNGTTYASYPADRRMRQDATATIALRNRLP
ncbi:pilus assembly protein PilW [Sulfuriferula plumbiphila]|nr:pilus assembly protein PilW [Sulfuriferula plumbiphila]